MTRETKEETSLDLEPIAIMGVYSDPTRYPRMRTLSVTFVTKIAYGNEAPNDDAAGVLWVNVEGELDTLLHSNQIAFDHPKVPTGFKDWRKEVQVYTEKNNYNNNIPTFRSTKKREAETEDVS